MKYIFRKVFWGCFFIPVFLLCSGCCPVVRQTNHATYRVITQIDVLYKSGALENRRQIFQEVKMRPILDYLRYLDPYGTPQNNPENIDGTDIFITIFYSDGSQCTYQQRSDRYFRKNNEPWKRVDQAKAMELKMLLWMIPGDVMPVQEEPASPLIMPRI